MVPSKKILLTMFKKNNSSGKYPLPAEFYRVIFIFIIAVSGLFPPSYDILCHMLYILKFC